jgi:hypothetical protein
MKALHLRSIAQGDGIVAPSNRIRNDATRNVWPEREACCLIDFQQRDSDSPLRNSGPQSRYALNEPLARFWRTEHHAGWLVRQAAFERFEEMLVTCHSFWFQSANGYQTHGRSVLPKCPLPCRSGKDTGHLEFESLQCLQTE